MNGQLSLDDCTPDWDEPEPEDGDRTPSQYHVRQQEMYDLHNQGAGPYALRTAHDVPTGSYL